MRQRSVGHILLGLWLVISCGLALFPTLGFMHAGTVLAILGLVAGILILAGR